MKKILAILLMLTMLLTVAACNSGGDRGTTADTAAETSKSDVQPLFDESIEYDENDEVVAAFAKSSDKSIESLLASLGDKYTIDSEQLINWEYDSRCGYATYERVKAIHDAHLDSSRPYLEKYIDLSIYKKTSPCKVTLINVNGTPYAIYSTVKTREEMGLFAERRAFWVDEATVNTVFRIVKDCGELVWDRNETKYSEMGSAVYHDTDFIFLYQSAF